MGIRKVGAREVTRSMASRSCRTGSYTLRAKIMSSKMLRCCEVVCLIFLLVCPAPVGGNAGSDYLDQKEWEVEMIRAQAVSNYIRQCDLATTCGNLTVCSHQSCAPLIGDATYSTCVNVGNNKYCPLAGASDKTCSYMNFDYRSSYVRLPETTTVTSADTVLAICAQRELDGLMKNISKPDDLTRLYFASVDGTWRTFPGSAQAQNDDCGKFDARVRSWYRTATSVTKVVVILIDIGASMSSNLSPGLGAGTIFQAAKRIVAELLRTLSVQDYVNIIVFDSTRIMQLSPSAVLVRDNNGTVGPELEFLKTELEKQTVEDQLKPSDLPAAMSAALKNFDSNPLAAKVMLVITDGMFATLGNVTSLPTANLSSLGVKVFIYKLPQTNDRDIYWAKNSVLTSQLCDVGGHFEPILKNLGNPLLAIRNFFSYLANLKRALTNGGPQYSYVYQDFDKIGGNITTVTKPAFGPSGELIGVAGITIYMGSLGNITEQVNLLLQNKTTGNTLLASPIVLTAGNCTILSKSVEPCGGTTYYESNAGLCQKTDDHSNIQDLTCCGSCKHIPQPAGPPPHVPIAPIVGGSIAGAVVLGLLVLIIYWRRDEPCNRTLNPCAGDLQQPENDEIPAFEGGYADPVVEIELAAVQGQGQPAV